MPIDGIDRPIEAKVRRGGFKQIYAWLAGRFAVLAKADRQEALITLRLTDFAQIAARADKVEQLLGDRDEPKAATVTSARFIRARDGEIDGSA